MQNLWLSPQKTDMLAMVKRADYLQQLLLLSRDKPIIYLVHFINSPFDCFISCDLHERQAHQLNNVS